MSGTSSHHCLMRLTSMKHQLYRMLVYWAMSVVAPVANTFPPPPTTFSPELRGSLETLADSASCNRFRQTLSRTRGRGSAVLIPIRGRASVAPLRQHTGKRPRRLGNSRRGNPFRLTLTSGSAPFLANSAGKPRGGHASRTPCPEASGLSSERRRHHPRGGWSPALSP